MTHNSKKDLDSDIAERLDIQFAKIIKLAGQKEHMSSITEEFFTNAEKIMFSKRLGAILLLHKKLPQHVICEMLKMSPSTVSRLSLSLEVGKYDDVVKLLQKENKFLDVLIEILSENLPRPFSKSRGSFGSIYKSWSEYKGVKTREKKR